MLWCVVYAETECESSAGQTNNKSLHPGPDHPPTTLNADELVATTTGQPQRPQGYLGSGVMWQECVCVFGVTRGYSSGFEKKKKSGGGLSGDGVAACSCTFCAGSNMQLLHGRTQMFFF